jgi:hypothetical protein
MNRIGEKLLTRIAPISANYWREPQTRAAEKQKRGFAALRLCGETIHPSSFSLDPRFYPCPCAAGGNPGILR